MRVDFNVDIQAVNNPTETLRLQAAKKSIEYILKHSGATLTLITHFGRPVGKSEAEYSVKVLVPVLEEMLGQSISFTQDCLASDDFSSTNLALRENLRFYSEEEANDAGFAEKLSRGFDMYVNEAFSVCHRRHASVVAITQFFPSVAGLHLQKEITTLEQALKNPERPAIAILAGAKIETKLPLIKVFEKEYDRVLLGGMIANEARDQQIPLEKNSMLPVDFRGDERFDIGDKTVALYTDVIKEAKTIIWNGTLGMFEKPPYDTGTNKIIDAFRQSSAYIIAGGGDSLTAIQKANAFDRFDLVSTGGGAMLDFLAGEVMPGIEALG